MLTIGLDVHERTTSLCILDACGRVVKEKTIRGHPRLAIAWLTALSEPFQVCFEASTNYGWLYEQLAGVAKRVVVAHPARLKLIFKSRRKNDRLDAARLAKLLFLNEVPEVHVPPKARRDWRSLIEYRTRCVRERTRTKNMLRALLRTHGIESPKSLWTKTGLAWIQELPFESSVALRREMLLETLEHQAKKIDRVERALRETAGGEPGVALLMTIPGVGVRTAEAFVAYVDDPHRFRANSIGAYLGLVPRQDASAGVNRLGRITREGPSTVRKMLAEATWQSIRRSPTVRAIAERFQGNRADRKKKALIATSHYLARVMLAMLKTGEVWRETPPLARTA